MVLTGNRIIRMDIVHIADGVYQLKAIFAIIAANNYIIGSIVPNAGQTLHRERVFVSIVERRWGD
jgi:hypothetical protein